MSASSVHLRKIPLSEVAVLDAFALEADELEFAGGTARQIAGRIADHPCPQEHILFLIFHHKTPVGFLCLRDGCARPRWASHDAMTLHNLRIGGRWRGKGFGHAAILASLQWVTEQRPNALRLELSVNEANVRAIQLYERCGFVRTGSSHAGRLGRELIMRIPVMRPDTGKATD